MSKGLDNLKHIVVLMMENRSFDHMLGGLKRTDARINGLNGDEWNPDATGARVVVQPTASFQGQLDHDPDHHFAGVDLQIFGGAEGPDREPNMLGFVRSYATQSANVQSSHAIMNYFPPERVPILTALATEYAVFNGWFASIPGPTICNRAFAHYGTSYGNVDMNLFYTTDAAHSIYERMRGVGRSAKIYYYDQQSSTIEIVNLLQHQPDLFADYPEFQSACESGTLPDYSFIEPNYTDHPGPGGGQVLASDQHPDHNVKAGERFIAMVYNAIRTNAVWENTALLIVYDEHGGLYDHVHPPRCTPDGHSAKPAATGTGTAFEFDRLGVRVPAVLVSPYIAAGTVVPGPEDQARERIFEHASIPATVTDHFIGKYDQRTDREKKADTFLDLLTDNLRGDDDCIAFNL
jgi:phospholipase C